MGGGLKLFIVCAAAWVCSISAMGFAARADLRISTKAGPIHFTIDGATKKSYKQFIEAFREELRSGEIHGIPVLRDPSTLDERHRYATVELSSSADVSITIGIDLTNAYVVAYQAGDQSYFLRDAPSSASDYLFNGTQQHSLSYSGSYTDLERAAGRRREVIPLGLDPLSNAIYSLRSGTGGDAQRARSLIVIIQMVCEAARFRYIKDRVGDMIGSGPREPDPAVLSLENNWGALSSGIQESVQGTFPRPVSIQTINRNTINVDSLSHQSIGVIALMLFVCRRDSNQSPLLIRSIVEKSEICDVFEPTVRIAGRDGMCVDVYDNKYNDGNPIILWRCKDQLEENQLWTLKQDKTIRSKGRCLTTYGYAAGNYVMIYDCSTAVPDATYWEIWDNGTIINPRSGLVLSAEKGTMGATLTVQQNDYRMRQGWRPGNDTSSFVTSISGYSDLCMEAQGNNNMWLASCDNNKEEQKWALYPDGSVRPKQNTNKCLTSEDHKQGATIVMMDCSNAWASQRWVFKNDGTIYSLSDDMVMDVKSSDPSLKQIILWPWTGNDNQMWLTLFW